MRTNTLLFLLFLQIAASPAFAAGKPEPLPPGMGKYIMVLWPHGSPVPGGSGTVKDVPEPDVVKAGGKVLAKFDNERLITLPLAAAAELRRHAAVVYLQRVWTGESLANWNESYPSPSVGLRLQLTPHSDTNLQWGPKAYTYDGSGNVKEIGTDQYAYDSAERLIKAVVDGKTETYAYDSFGNLTQKAVAGGNPVNVNVDGASNRLIGVDYDAAGNVGSADDGRRVYKYDSLNMLTRVQRSFTDERRMIYDADDERIGTINVGDTLSRWTIRDFEGRIVREFKADSLQAWFWEQDYFYGGGVLIGGESQEWGYDTYRYGGKRHYHLDHLGNVRMVTDAGTPAQSISEHEYLPFGATLTKTYQEQIRWGDPHIDSMRFAGHWRDFLGGLDVDNTDYVDYMHARYYDPNLGRFSSVDPVDGDRQNPQTWNRYTYARNSPLRHTDPTGEEPCTVSDPGINGGQPFQSDCVTVDAQNPSDLEHRMTMWNLEMTQHLYFAGRFADMVAQEFTAPYGHFANAVLNDDPKALGLSIVTPAMVAMGPIDPEGEIVEAAEAAHAVEEGVVEATEHGAGRLAGRGAEAAWTRAEVEATRAGIRTVQRDGAEVFIKEVKPGRYNVIVQNEATGKVITTFRQLSMKSMQRLARNYGWGWP